MELKPCSRCSRLFRASHGNQKLCGPCRAGRVGLPPQGFSFGVRWCDRCGREFVARAPNHRFCCKGCERLARTRLEVRLYATPEHRGARRRWTPMVASGTVRCARGGACGRAELIDGELVGGLIEPGEVWHLGHRERSRLEGPSTFGAIPVRRRGWVRGGGGSGDGARVDGCLGLGEQAAGVFDRL